jgi:DNA adenine methylase
MEPRRPKPFLKWAGGKGQLLTQLSPLFPRSFARYFEPFVGGCAVFFHLQPRSSTLTDINRELIDCYRAVKGEVEDVIAALSKHVYEREHYYRVRAVEPESLPAAARAARTIYLNKTGFNGLYRVNSSGRFNVPFGRYARPTFCDPMNLRACSAALRRATLAVGDFASVLDSAKKRDFVYFDPPYVPVSDTSDFTAYVPGGFGWKDQERLAEVVADLDRRGAYVMLSNSDVPRVRNLYARYRIERVQAARNINSKASGRGKIGEVVVLNYG